MSSSVRINGLNIVAGRNIVIKDGRVLVDGKEVTVEDQKKITIEVTGNVDSISVDSCDWVTVSGSVRDVKSEQGNINIGGDVTGTVKTEQGSIAVGGAVGGDVETEQGDVIVTGSVSGKVTTEMGNITHGRAR